ncbi:hypothetical protein HPB50_007478 [Hyalomma asiaticum]|uniref:Uncharacterized protein n=1 Tax=Hyalomma asiaticum TaxID=266040 RepID=A0ACB7SM45_HYAAI|nr:hypothetical protein HPB50_007478 [Hyalomma asiaticum]
MMEERPLATTGYKARIRAGKTNTHSSCNNRKQSKQSRDSNFGGSSRTVGGTDLARTRRRLLNRSFLSLSLQAMALSSRGRQSREEGRSSHVPHTKATHSLIIIMAAAGCPMSVALGLSGVSRRSVGQSPPSLSLSEPVGRSVHWNKPAAGEGTLAQTLTCFLPCDQQRTKPHHPSSVLCSP